MELVNIEKSLKQLTVVKRNGRKVEFEGDKIAIAIKKAFDSVENEKYTEKDGVLKFYYDINPLRAIDSAKIMKLTADSLVLMQYNCRFVFVRSKKKLKRFSYSRPHAK